MKSITHLLATDLDDTLVGLKPELKELTDMFNRIPQQVSLVYVTGRHAESVKQLMTEENLPMPDLVISDVGTKIWHMPDWIEDTDWCDKVTADWRPDLIKKAAARFPKLVPQRLPDDRRISFTIQNDQKTVHQFEQILIQRQLPHRLIYSSNLNVDVLPLHAGKGNAVEYVLTHYYDSTVNVLVAGDSENDLDMLNRGWPSVVVGNAQPGLSVLPETPYLFKAERHCAGGIYDAWQHFYGN
ncbi:HAD-IIB family hydrolase [Sporosarcina aquimarina]|uniref:HAD-IIB family hydrolase n=2 Tax=Sporosarcina aquimarina TaxID=114975 RepID=A0ABU4G2S9_9BACL|nr:HAD-IIB family hydrolase [Sporosarcina aquimarina]